MASGLWEQTTDLFPEWIDRPFAEMGMFLIACMFHLQAEKVDALNRVWPTGWNELLCGDRLPNTPTLVDLINLIGQNPGEVAKWQGVLAAKWISDASRLRAVLVASGQPCVLLETPAISSACEQARNALLARGMVEFWFRVLDGAPILLLSQTAPEGIRPYWKEWILPQIRDVAHARVRTPTSSTSRESRPRTIVFANSGVDLRFFRKLQREGLHVLSYRLSADDLWPVGTFVEEEIEVQPGHRESVLIAERELGAGDSPPVRLVRCILRNGPQLTVISSDRELSLHRVAARMAFEFTASRFWDCLKRNFALLRSFNAQRAATGIADSKVNSGLEGFVGAIAMVVSRAEAITERVLREKLPRSLECPSVVPDILAERVDLVPAQGANILRVLVHVKGDVGEQAAVASLCVQLTATETRFPGTNLRLVYEPLAAPCSA